MKLLISVEGKQYEVDVEVLDEGQGVPAPAARPAVSAPPAAAAPLPPKPSAAPAAAAAAGGDVTSPIAGTVVDVRVKAGDEVKVNDTLLVLEAMKMESNVASTGAGVVKEVCVSAGDAVTQGQVLVKF